VGVDREEALCAATRTPAEAIGLPDRAPALSEGMSESALVFVDVG
jgi:imidazolonepropionase-like amidohydrolase